MWNPEQYDLNTNAVGDACDDAVPMTPRSTYTHELRSVGGASTGVQMGSPWKVRAFGGYGVIGNPAAGEAVPLPPVESYPTFNSGRRTSFRVVAGFSIDAGGS